MSTELVMPSNRLILGVYLVPHIFVSYGMCGCAVLLIKMVTKCSTEMLPSQRRLCHAYQENVC